MEKILKNMKAGIEAGKRKSLFARTIEIDHEIRELRNELILLKFKLDEDAKCS